MSQTQYNWINGSAYDFFISLHVLHDPATFGLRGSWAAGVRSRLPAAERKTLEEIDAVFNVPVEWVNTLPEPRDARTVLDALAALPAEKRLPALWLTHSMPDRMCNLLIDIAARNNWTPDDLDRLRQVYRQQGWTVRQGVLEIMLNLWAQSRQTGEALLAALQVYYDVFFAEEERRIQADLQRAIDQAKALSAGLEPAALVERLSRGVHFPEDWGNTALILAPSYWITPLVIVRRLAADQRMLVFGARPAHASLVPGEAVPDALLQSLKALADPTRLRILRYLADQPLTPTQLARKLRLRAPTVVHHLAELRLAGLVHLTLTDPEKKSERRYAARLQAVNETFHTLEEFLSPTDRTDDRFEESNTEG